ncbi:heat stress transcription factor B-4-like protein [Tanacetum coccineum]
MEAPQKTVDGHHQSTHRRSRSSLWYSGRMYVSGRVDIFDMVDIDLFTVVALNMIVLKLGTQEDVCCLATLVRSFKLIEVYIEHGVTVLDSYLRAPRFRATLEDITDEPGSIAVNRTEKILLLTWHKSSETTKEPVCDSVTPSSLPQDDSSTPCKDSVSESITPRCMTDCILIPLTDESVITYTQLSGVQGATSSQVIDDVIRQLSFDETKLDGEAGFADVAGSGVDSSGLSHDESFGVDDLDLNLNEEPNVNLNVSQVETQSELPVSEEPDVEVSTEHTSVPIVEEVETQEFSVEDVVLEDYVSSREDAAQYNGEFNESARSDGKFFFDDEGLDTEYDVQSSEDAGTYDDDVADEDFLVDEENGILEPDVDVHLFFISMDLPFDNIGVTNLVPNDVLEGEDVDVINPDGFDSDYGNDEETNYRKRRLAELRTEMEEAKDRVYLHSIESRRNLKLFKNDGVRIRARCDGKVLVFTMSQGDGPTGPNRGMEPGPSGSSDSTTRSKKKEEYMVNPDISVKAVQDQLQRELEVQISMSKTFRAKAKAKREIRGDYVLQYSMLRDYVVELQSTKPNTTVKIAVERNTDPSLPTRGLFPGQVLVAVGLDSNNGIYPLANALVEAEMINKRAKSDLLLNNICEVFNGKIVGGRDKPVITLLEYIREYCMKRIVNIQGVIDKCTSPLTPTATRITESIMKEAHLMKVQWNGANKYQVSGLLGDQCVVDVVTMTCSCRKCELTGIPCKHDVAACWNMALNDRATPPPGKSLLLVEYMEGNIFSQDTTNLWDQVLGEVQMSNNTFATQASCPGGNNAKGSGTASTQAQQTEVAVGQDGSGGSGAGAIIGLSATAGKGG